MRSGGAAEAGATPFSATPGPTATGPRRAHALAAIKRPSAIWIQLQECTGCVESVLRQHRAGGAGQPLAGMLERTRPDEKRYIMNTDSWYLERRIYLAVGINVSVASVLSLVWTPWWLLFTGFVGAAMVWFAATGYCIMANGLYWLGAEPRLSPEKRRPAGSAMPERATTGAG